MHELVRVGRLSDIRESVPVLMQHQGVPYCVVRTQGAIRAFIPVCSHEDKQFKPEMSGSCLVCPFHSVHFDATTGKVKQNNGKKVPEGLRTVSTEANGDWLYLVAEDAHCNFFAESAARREERRSRKRNRRRWWNFFR